jgi:hypothetical protein
MLGWIRGKLVILESTIGDGKFFASNSTIVRNGALTCNDPCAPNGDYSTVVGNGS